MGLPAVKRIAALLLSLALCAPAAAYWQSRQQISVGAAPAAFAGIGDVVAAANFYYGLRAYAVATKGTPAVNVCIPADATCADFSTDATSGSLVIGLIGGSSCAVVTCTIKTWYDQSGHNLCSAAPCNITQATIANRAVLMTSCIGALPCAVFSGNVTYTSASVALSNGEVSFALMANRTGSFTTQQVVSTYNGALFNYFPSSADKFNFFPPGTASTATDGVFHSVQSVCPFTSGTVLAIDGVIDTRTLCGSFAGNGSIVLGDTSTAYSFTEFAMWGKEFASVLLTPTQIADLNSNIHSYWGF